MEALFFEKEVFFEGCECLSRLVRGKKRFSRRHQGTKEEGLKTFCHRAHIEHIGFISEFQIHILLWIL